MQLDGNTLYKWRIPSMLPAYGMELPTVGMLQQSLVTTTSIFVFIMDSCNKTASAALRSFAVRSWQIL